MVPLVGSSSQSRQVLSIWNKAIGKKATQFKPYLKLNNQILPSVEINGTFQYLGKQFSYKMETDEIENDLQSELTSYLEKNRKTASKK